MKDIERIICSAIYYPNEPTPVHTVKNLEKGLVLCGHRHNHVISLFTALTGRSTNKTEHIQGFLTSKNEFVGRQHAMVIAHLAGQVDDKTFENNKKLYSEDLY